MKTKHISAKPPGFPDSPCSGCLRGHVVDDCVTPFCVHVRVNSHSWVFQSGATERTDVVLDMSELPTV